MKTSVALCTYNGEKYVEKQLYSLLNQSRRPDEIVICDDCSKDKTIELAKAVLEKCDINYRLVKNETNLGFAKNFKKCMSLCDGDIIFLCDQDDIWREDKVETISDIMKSNSQILSITTNFRLVDVHGEFIGKNTLGDNPWFNKKKREIDYTDGNLYKVSIDTFFYRNIAPGCTQAVRKNIVEEYINREVSGPHDWELSKLATIKNGAFYLDLPLTYYRHHANQTIGVPGYALYKIQGERKKMLRAWYGIFKEFIYLIFFSDKDVFPEYASRINSKYISDNLETIRQSGKVNLQKCEKYLIRGENRTILYNKGKFAKRFKAFIKQGRYNKYFLSGYACIERINTRMTDLLVLLKRK